MIVSDAPDKEFWLSSVTPRIREEEKGLTESRVKDSRDRPRRIVTIRGGEEAEA